MKKEFYRYLAECYRCLIYFLGLASAILLKVKIYHPVKVLLLYVVLFLTSFLIHKTSFSNGLSKLVLFFLVVVYCIFSANLGPTAGKLLAAYIVVVSLVVLMKKPKNPSYLKEPILVFVSALDVPPQFSFLLYLAISSIFFITKRKTTKTKKKVQHTYLGALPSLLIVSFSFSTKLSTICLMLAISFLPPKRPFIAKNSRILLQIL